MKPLRWAIILVAVLAAAVTGCGDSANEASASTPADGYRWEGSVELAGVFDTVSLELAGEVHPAADYSYLSTTGIAIPSRADGDPSDASLERVIVGDEAWIRFVPSEAAAATPPSEELVWSVWYEVEGVPGGADDPLGEVYLVDELWEILGVAAEPQDVPDWGLNAVTGATIDPTTWEEAATTSRRSLAAVLPTVGDGEVEVVLGADDDGRLVRAKLTLEGDETTGSVFEYRFFDFAATVEPVSVTNPQPLPEGLAQQLGP